MGIFERLKNKFILFRRHKHLILKPANEETLPVTNIGPLIYSEIFDCQKKYQYIMDVLVTKKWVSPVNFYWTENSSGKKRRLVTIIKYCQVMGYYKKNQTPSNPQIKAICLNSFNVTVSLHYIKHINVENVSLSYIPKSSDLKLSDENKIMS